MKIEYSFLNIYSSYSTNGMSLVTLKYSPAQNVRRHFHGVASSSITNVIIVQKPAVKNVHIVKNGFQATAHLLDIFVYILEKNHSHVQFVNGLSFKRKF